MEKIVDYKIIAAVGQRIDSLVVEAIRDGWQPLGGVAIGPGGTIVMQAVVKQELEENEK